MFQSPTRRRPRASCALYYTPNKFDNTKRLPKEMLRSPIGYLWLWFIVASSLYEPVKLSGQFHHHWGAFCATPNPIEHVMQTKEHVHAPWNPRIKGEDFSSPLCTPHQSTVCRLDTASEWRPRTVLGVCKCLHRQYGAIFNAVF